MNSGISALYTDFYELIMAQSYFLLGKHKSKSVFDYFFRRLPFGNGYVIFSGLYPLLDQIKTLSFSKDDIQFLKGTGHFKEEFLTYLSMLSFNDLEFYSFDEGDIVFPNEPIVRVHGQIDKCLIIESLLLNHLNYSSLIATKARRIHFVATQYSNKKISFIDMGLRRAQGFGAMLGSRSAFIGGCDGTSNTLAAKEYGIPCIGTMSHAFIMSFDNELSAFRHVAETQKNVHLLLDTYDTLNSGIKNAITVAKELESSGRKLLSVRIDSGDLAYLSKEVRLKLDQHGLHDVKIVASNSLNETLIKSLLEQNACIDIYGIGTELITGGDQPYLDGVYKLSSFDGVPKIKLSNNIGKMTLPSIKNVLRLYTSRGHEIDCIYEEKNAGKKQENIINPMNPMQSTKNEGFLKEEVSKLRKKSMDIALDINAIKKNSLDKFIALPIEYKRFNNPNQYRVGVSYDLFTSLLKMRDSVVETTLDRM